MISKDDIEAFKEDLEDFKENVAIQNASSLSEYIFRYEKDGPDGYPDMSFAVRQIDRHPGDLLFTVSDDWFNSDKMSIFLPKHVVREMIKAMEKVL